MSVWQRCQTGYYSLRFSTTWQSNFPRLTQWFDRLHQRPSLQETLPKASIIKSAVRSVIFMLLTADS